MTESDRLSHAYIADEHNAYITAMTAVCSGTGNMCPCNSCKHCDKAARNIHPDIITVSRMKDKKEIVIDQIREVKTDAYILPNEAEKKVYIINEAEKMNPNAQNAFLQVLEEPPAHVVFILKTDNPAALLPTVRSRCVKLLAKPDPGASAETATDEQFEDIDKLSRSFVKALDDNMLLTQCMFSLEKLDKSGFTVFTGLTRGYLTGALRADPRKKKASQAYDLLIEADEMLEYNINTGHISGMLCASLME